MSGIEAIKLPTIVATALLTGAIVTRSTVPLICTGSSLFKTLRAIVLAYLNASTVSAL